MDILEVIEKRANCAFGSNILDEMLADASKSKEEIVPVILTENELSKRHGVNAESVTALLDNNRLMGMFNLGHVLLNTNIDLVLYVFTKKQVSKFTVGEYNGRVFRNRKTPKEQDWNTVYTEEFYAYLKQIEEWVSSGSISDTETAKFNDVNIELFEGSYFPKRYSGRAFRIRNALKNEKTVELSEVAEVIRPRVDRDKKAMHLPASEWEHPINYGNLKEGVLTNAPVQKNDILFLNFNKLYLVEEQPQQEFHVSPNCYIIRPKNILPQYLFMYLESETAKTIMQSLAVGGVLSRVLLQDMLNIPIIMPTLSDMEYISTYDLRFHKHTDIADFSRNKRFLAYYERFYGLLKNQENTSTELSKAKETNVETVEDILGEEWAHNIRICKADVMQEFLDADINELNSCFRAKAFKATLILAGSILEAVLIDWLSEIKNEDYFDEPYMVRKRSWDKNNNRPRVDRNGNPVYYEKEAGLADYIDEIKELARPRWMKSEEAHEIRRKRNLVHAKLCMSETTEINEETCREVIQYLKEVIETRGIQQN